VAKPSKPSMPAGLKCAPAVPAPGPPNTG
jgi:hypothetical protein